MAERPEEIPPRLSEHDAQLLRSAQVALEEMSVSLLEKSRDKGRFASDSQYAAGWADSLRWASQQCATRAKALGKLRG